jgi:hypothetical protein
MSTEAAYLYRSPCQIVPIASECRCEATTRGYIPGGCNAERRAARISQTFEFFAGTSRNRVASAGLLSLGVSICVFPTLPSLA